MFTRRPGPLGAVVYRSSLLDGRGVPHAFSTRLGGVSRGLFESLNLGNPSDLPADQRDPVANIRENWRRVLDAAGAGGRELVEVHQVHGGAVHAVRAGRPAHDGPHDTKADAIVTDDPARAVAVRVADCAPVLLAGGDGRIVAAVHAGWRGVVAGVAAGAVEAMRRLGAADIAAAIGPCIGPDAFEVGPEVLEAFAARFGAAPGVIAREDRATGKGHVDLKAALRAQLAAAGVERLDVCEACVHRDRDEFFSHRRDRGRTGRLAGLIGPRGPGG